MMRYTAKKLNALAIASALALATQSFPLLGFAQSLTANPSAFSITPSNLINPLGAARVVSQPSTQVDAQAVPGQVLIRYNSTLSAQSTQPAIATLASRVTTLGHSGYNLVELKPGFESIDSAMASLRALPGVAAVQPNYIYHATALTNDPEIGQQWALQNSGQTIDKVDYTTNNPGIVGDDIGVAAAWKHQSDCSSVIVAVVDEGINYTQQDLAANMWNGGSAYPNHGYDFVSNDNNPYPSTGDEQHGTHVAGIIGAQGNNGIEGSGVCQKASLMAIRSLSSTGGTTATVTQGINFAVDHGAKIINLSLGGGSTLDPAFSDAITYAQSKGVIVIVAAGNGDAAGNGVDNDQTPMYPCNFTQSNLICVAAVDQAFELASFSNYGAASVDVGAPGTNILSTVAGASQTSDFVNWTGSHTAGSGWGYGTTTTGAPILVDPVPYGGSNVYANNTTDQVWSAFSFGADVQHVALNFYRQGVVGAGDFLSTAVIAGNQNPFPSGARIDTVTGALTPPANPLPVDQCAAATCSIGFELRTDASGNATGPLIALFNLDTVAQNTSAMGVLNGTSMAAPMVSGIAALLMASKPSATPDQIIQAIETTGTPAPSLTGKTTTGKVVRAINALAKVNLGIAPITPVNLTAGVSQTVRFTIRGLDALSLSATSSNTAVLPNSAITGQAACTVAGQCTLNLLPSAAGVSTVTLSLQDGYGQQITQTLNVNVAAATPMPTPATATSGGGGSMNLAFLLGFGLIFALNRRLRAKRFSA